jgi:hypothetical protein
VRPVDLRETRERRARIERLIAEFREAKKRRLVKVALKLWRQSEAEQRLLSFEAPPDRIH